MTTVQTPKQVSEEWVKLWFGNTAVPSLHDNMGWGGERGEIGKRTTIVTSAIRQN